MAGNSRKPVGALRVSITLALLILAFVPAPGFLAKPEDAPLAAALLHHFWHANAFHLCANLIAAWLVFAPGRNMSELFLGWGLASLSFVVATGPTLGFSNILLAVAGYRSATYPKAYWKSPTAITFIVVMLAMAFLPMFSAWTHLLAFSLGLIYGSIRNTLIKIKNDCEQATR